LTQNPTQPDPWMDLTHVQLCDNDCQIVEWWPYRTHL